MPLVRRQDAEGGQMSRRGFAFVLIAVFVAALTPRPTLSAIGQR